MSGPEDHTAKREYLAYLARVHEACAADLQGALHVSLPTAGMALLRLTRSGLVSRTFDTCRQCHFYAITPKGLARLAFLEAEEDR